MRKLGLVSVLAVTLVLAATVCAFGAEIVFWHSYSQPERIAAIHSAIERFEEKYPDITVKSEMVPWGMIRQKWTTAMMAGTLPQVSIASDSEMIAMWEAGILEDLSYLVEEMGGRDVFLPGPLDGLKYQGSQMGIPHYTLSWMMVYRTDWLEGLGLEEPKTWDELLEVVTAITDPPHRYGMDIPLSREAQKSKEWLAYFMRTNGAEFVDADGNVVFNSPETIETVNFMLDIIKNASRPAAVNYSEDDTRNNYVAGNTGFIFTSGTLAGVLYRDNPDLLDKTKVIPTPYNKQPGIPGAGPVGIVKFANRPHSKEADLFIKFLLDDEVYVDFLPSMLGMVPVTVSASQSERYFSNPAVAATRHLLQSWTEGAFQGLRIGMDHGLDPRVAFGITGSIIEDMFHSILIDGVSVEDAVAKVHNLIEEQIAAAGY